MASDHGRAEYHEGPVAATRFERVVNRVLKVSKEELSKREAAYQKSRRNRNRRKNARAEER